MFRHKGKRRTYYHNLLLASILSFVAGIVNVTSVLALNVLTTNITGHFAYFAEHLINSNLKLAAIFLMYSVCFLGGAFVSNFCAETFSRKDPRLTYTVPLMIEILAISTVMLLYTKSIDYVETVAGILLFAMGLQNAMVTKISQSVVRTTHLTGIFTDLGIELSQLFFYRDTKKHQRLYRNIHLKVAIVLSFFAGGIIGGYGYKQVGLYILGLAVGIIFIAMIHDYIRYHYYNIKRIIRNRR
ncbi:DUF1275 domain-containing protein [Sphingobacterium sp. SGG-5]|uniref:YoaK family protein n=1 Tax=Sphingobacterium sp. SGG-5 TaxID=2710881 RepID=UPI0013EAB923|nr:YoaK family protein [Sphingobacterium sp. SGG-5]NGM61073.1 DUF1275 domain-containing protein [Sphingobacterium sp. SGG-5]